MIHCDHLSTSELLGDVCESCADKRAEEIEAMRISEDRIKEKLSHLTPKFSSDVVNGKYCLKMVVEIGDVSQEIRNLVEDHIKRANEFYGNFTN